MIGFVGLLVLVVLVAFMLPREAILERSILIDRPQKTVFTILNGYRNFSEWSPWAELDPDATVTLNGPMQGVGASYTWSSNEASVGSGYQEIIESRPDDLIRSRLEFSGMESQSSASFLLTRVEDSTKVSWRHEVNFGSSLFGRFFGLFLDTLVGKDYERGLGRLKAFAESQPAADFSDLEVATVSIEPITIVYLPGSAATRPDAIAEAYGQTFTTLRAVLARNGLSAMGPRLVIGRKWDQDNEIYEFEAAYPVTERADTLETSTEAKLGKTYSGKVLKATHKGPYAGLSDHFQKLMAYKRAMGFVDNGPPWDVYVSDPQRTPQAELLTETFMPVR